MVKAYGWAEKVDFLGISPVLYFSGVDEIRLALSAMETAKK